MKVRRRDAVYNPRPNPNPGDAVRLQQRGPARGGRCLLRGGQRREVREVRRREQRVADEEVEPRLVRSRARV